MGYQSQFKVEFSKSCYGCGNEIISLVDNLMQYEWNLGFEKTILILDKGNDFKFLNLPYTLTSLHNIYKILNCKEIEKEFIKLTFSHNKSKKGIEFTFDYKREKTVIVDLQNEDKDLRISDPVNEMNRFLALFYKPCDSWRKIISIQYITGYDYSVILELRGTEILKHVQNYL